MLKTKKIGQAVIEYLLVLSLMTFLGLKILTYVRDFLDTSITNLSHVISIHLTVGVCKGNCFFTNYLNGFEN